MTENNILMSKFMSLDFSTENPILNLYRSSWEAIMPVVEKINSMVVSQGIQWNGFKITPDCVYINPRHYCCTYRVGEGKEHYKDLKHCTYQACVDFIIWNNSKKLYK